MGLLTFLYVKLRVAHEPGMPGTLSPPPRVCDPDKHHGTCITRVPWCMPGLLTSGFLRSRWRGKRSRHSRCMRKPQFNVSGKRPMYLVSDPDSLASNHTVSRLHKSGEIPLLAHPDLSYLYQAAPKFKSVMQQGFIESRLMDGLWEEGVGAGSLLVVKYYTQAQHDASTCACILGVLKTRNIETIRSCSI